MSSIPRGPQIKTKCIRCGKDRVAYRHRPGIVLVDGKCECGELGVMIADSEDYDEDSNTEESNTEGTGRRTG